MILLCFLFLIGIFVIAFFILYIKGEDKRNLKYGENYEKNIVDLIKKVFEVNVYRSVLIFIEPNRSTEIDIVFVNTKGIFCIECKYRNNVETRYINLDNNEWYEGENALEQNKHHVYHFKKNITAEFPVFNIVMFNHPFQIKYLNNIYNSGKNSCFSLLHTREPIAIVSNDIYDKKAMQKFKKETDELPDKLTNDDIQRIEKEIESHVATIEQHRDHAKRVAEISR